MTRIALAGLTLALLVSLTLPITPGQAQTPIPIQLPVDTQTVAPTATVPATVPATVTGAVTATVPATVTGAVTATVTITPVPTTSGLTVTSVNPPTGNAVSPTTITVTGTGFLPNAQIVLGNRPAIPAQFQSPTSLVATLPVGLPVGSYGVSVINPNNTSSPVLPNAFTVVGLGASLYVPIAVKQANGDDSGIQVQNLSGSSATIYLSYYDQNGFPVATDGPENVSAFNSVTFYQPSNTTLPSGFDGSAVVQSTQPIAAIVNRVNYTGANASAGSVTLPTGAGGSDVTVPLVYGGQNGYITTISVQNTSTSTATYTVNLQANGVTTPTTTVQVTIPSLAVKRLRVGTDLFVPSSFIGSATISGGGATLSAVAESRNSSNGILMSSAGFATGATTTNAPLMYKNYSSGWVSGAQVANMSNTTITVNAQLHERDTDSAIGLPPITLSPNQSYFYDMATQSFLPDGFIGSAVFTSTGPAAVTIQEVNSAQSTGMAYSGFSNGTNNISIPLIFKQTTSGWDTGVQVQNLGTIDATVSITYTLSTGFTISESMIANAGKSVTFYQPDNASLPSNTTGAATVTSNGPPIVAIVNEVNYQRTGDASMAYEGINY